MKIISTRDFFTVGSIILAALTAVVAIGSFVSEDTTSSEQQPEAQPESSDSQL